MNVAIICGSQRANSQSARVGSYLKKVLEAGHGCTVDWVDLGTANLPLWDADGQAKAAWAATLERCKQSDGLILITPEWSGMATPAVKNFLLMADKSIVGHKAGLLVAVSAARGGAYPISELRASGYKNNRICFIPDHLIVRNVGTVLNEGEADGKEDTYLRGQIEITLSVFMEYTSALNVVRSGKSVNDPKYPQNGM